MTLMRVNVHVIDNNPVKSKRKGKIRSETIYVFWCGSFSYPVIGVKTPENEYQSKYLRIIEIKLIEVDNETKKVMILEKYKPGERCVRNELIQMDYCCLEVLCGSRKNAEEIEKKLEVVNGVDHRKAKATGKRLYRKIKEVSFKNDDHE